MEKRPNMHPHNDPIPPAQQWSLQLCYACGPGLALLTAVAAAVCGGIWVDRGQGVHACSCLFV